MTKEEAKIILGQVVTWWHDKLHGHPQLEYIAEAAEIILSEPSLPSNLDEAAEEWCKTNNKGIALSADRKSHYLTEGKDAFKRGAEYGKEEVLKDLPRWGKWRYGALGNGRGIPIAIVKRGLNGYELVDSLGVPGERYIMLSDLEKLPGFKEDENHE